MGIASIVDKIIEQVALTCNSSCCNRTYHEAPLPQKTKKKLQVDKGFIYLIKHDKIIKFENQQSFYNYISNEC